MRVFRNDEMTPAEADRLNPDRMLISPGPCSPTEAGVSLDMIKTFAGKKPIFGVCLGHQAMGQYFGGKVVRAGRLMHGKIVADPPPGHRRFRRHARAFPATRYHSLLVERAPCPTASRSRPRRPRAKSWACATDTPRSGASSSTPNPSPPKMA